MFYRFVPQDSLRMFLPSELDKLIAGEEKINFQDMKRTNCVVLGSGFEIRSRNALKFMVLCH